MTKIDDLVQKERQYVPPKHLLQAELDFLLSVSSLRPLKLALSLSKHLIIDISVSETRLKSINTVDAISAAPTSIPEIRQCILSTKEMEYHLISSLFSRISLITFSSSYTLVTGKFENFRFKIVQIFSMQLRSEL